MKTTTYDETKWKLVPIEPTSEMLVRGGEEFFDSARNWKIGSTLRDQDHASMIYEGMLAAAPTPPAVEQPNEIPASMEQIGWQLIQKNGLSVGGIARSDEERESMMRSKHQFNPEIDTFRPVYAFRATPPAVEQSSAQDREDAERYRYLRTENAKPYERDGCLAVVYDDKEGGAWVGCDLDAAINAARKEQP